MSKKYFFIAILLASLVGGLVAVGFLQFFSEKAQPNQSLNNNQTGQFSNFLADSAFIVPEGINFVFAAKSVTPRCRICQVFLLWFGRKPLLSKSF